MERKIISHHPSLRKNSIIKISALNNINRLLITRPLTLIVNYVLVETGVVIESSELDTYDKPNVTIALLRNRATMVRHLF